MEAVTKPMQLKDYAKLSYTKYKSNEKYFQAMICALRHSEKINDTKELTERVRNCRENELRNEITERMIKSWIDKFANDTLLTFGIENNVITHHPTKLGSLVIDLYRKDKTIRKHHS